MSILAGVKNARRALTLLKEHPRLIPWALIPAMVTCAMSLVGVWLAMTYGDEVLTRLWPDPGHGALHWLWIITMSVVKLASSLLTLFITPWLVILFGIPLCDPLANRADDILGGENAEVSIMKGLGSAMVTAIMITGIGIVGSIVFFVLSFIPGVGLVVAPFVLLVWTPAIICFDLQDGPLSRRNISLRDKVRLIKSRPIESLAKGLILMGLLAVPVLNLLGLPIAVISAVIGVRDLEIEGTLTPDGTHAQV